MRVVGLDGTKGGWVGVELRAGRFVGTVLLRPFDTSFEEFSDADVIAIDIPIGFGPRDSDELARKLLGPAGATVFAIPARELFEQPFSRGLGISAQAHALGARIAHVTELAASDSRFHEVHPEVSFVAMNDGEPLRYRKKTAGGVYERLGLLRRHGIDPDELGEAAVAPIDDVLDAAAAAWSANRIATGEALSLPHPPERKDGLRVAIWY